MQISGAIQSAVRAVYDLAFPFATALAAVGLVSMALIQTVKDMLPVRRWFQGWWIQRWLRAQSLRSGEGGFASDPVAAERDLVRLATSGDRDALFDLPIEQVSGQMNAAAQIVLSYPREYSNLLYCLAAYAAPSDVSTLLGAPPTAEPERTAFVDARNRVTHQVQRSLDGLQISAGYRWKLYLQIASIVSSGLLTMVGVWFFSGQPIPAGRRFALYIAISVLGGFLAPVARDLVAALQQLRK